MNKFRNLISAIENYKLITCFILVLSLIFLRIFFEGILEGTHSIGYSDFSYRAMLMYFVHFPLFYLTTFLFIVIAISLFLNDNIIRVTKIASIGVVLIIFVPIIDNILCGGCFITYPSRLEKYFLHFLNPFASLLDIGVSTGQRIIIILISFLAGLYGYAQSKKFLNGIAIFFIVLLIILFLGALTTLIAMNRPEEIYITGGILNTDTQKFSAIYLFLFIIVFFVYLYLLNKKDFYQLISSMRVERMAFYGGAGLSGFLLAMHQSGLIYDYDLFNFLGVLFIFFCPALGFWVLQILNDFFDLKIDAKSKQRNPLLKGIRRTYYFFSGFIIFLVVMSMALILNYQAFLIMFTFFLLGILYSVPPIRLKRFPFISTFILSVAVILSICLGYSIIYFEKSFQQIPNFLFFALLSGITIGFSAKDINDVEGDRKNGIITLPLLFYKKENLLGRLPFSLILGSSFILIGIFMPEVWVGSFIAFLTIFFYTLLNKKPKEWFYFLILYIFGVYLLLSLLF
ncbi:MAG: UbiA family prenyltransferase [candidate division WOR-3 bacterium]